MASKKWVVVDLDGTLLKTDMLFESFWNSLASDWTILFRVLPDLFSGRAKLKEILAETDNTDPAVLPYNEEVISYIQSRKAKGDSIALVTASDQKIADKIAAHCLLFDHVKGSDGITNLKGTEKANYLSNTFGEQSFTYVGDSKADLQVWKCAKKAVTFTQSAKLRKTVEAISSDVTHLNQTNRKVYHHFRALRPHQWLKNILIFLPMVAAHEFTDGKLISALFTFISFSLIAASVYLINDLLDLSFDRLHHRKKNRPLAAGKLPLSHGTFLSPLLLILGLTIAVTISIEVLWVIAVYFILTSLYSLFLKQVAIFDILVLAILYSLRIYAGGVATEIYLSIWLIAFSLFFFFALAAVKRQAELVEATKSIQEKINGRGYNSSDLQIVSMMAMTSGYVSILVLILYINSDKVLLLYSSPQFLWGITLVLFYWLNRMVMVTHRGLMHDDPLVFAISDRASLISFFLITLLIVGGTFL